MEKNKRYWEIDAVRGIAVILMILYHICFDLDFLGIITIPMNSLFFLLFLYPIGTLFLLLVGISLTLRYAQMPEYVSFQKRFFLFFKQGMVIFSFGLLITVVTFLYPRQGFIMFGVLHCIGISIIIGYFFISKRFLSLIFGVLCIVFGLMLPYIQIESYWFLWLGFRPIGFYTLDYFPLLPWFGVVLIGIFLGNIFYPNGDRRFKSFLSYKPIFLNAFVFLGRHSLSIYLLHQPIIIGILTVFFVLL
ncbi:MAG: heparan-alpha-glucosaminide N-acetyltransferase [Candidatus Thermoplasmatota archaeon]|nr:heparan-alpha-glucosaminide N-acetyltransferase [Candidatus Thermoplasmatota archaeon]